MLVERVFWILAVLSPVTLRSRVVRRATGVAAPKLHPVWKDGYKPALFAVVGIWLPVFLSGRPVGAGMTIGLRLLGVYVVLLVVQHQVNVALLDGFRADRLPLRHGASGIWRTIDNWTSRVLPLDAHAVDYSRHRLSSGQRRIVLAVLDFWLLLVGFALVYWSTWPNDFTPRLTDFGTALYFSVVAGTTLGFGDIVPRSMEARLAAAGETLSCFLFALIVIGHWLSLLPQAQRLEN